MTEAMVSVVMPVGGAVLTDEWRLHAFEWVSERYRRLLPRAELVIHEYKGEPYNRSAARNEAVRIATGRILVIVDADTVFGAGQLVTAIQRIDNGLAPWSIPYDVYYNLGKKMTVYLVQEYPPEADVAEPGPDEAGEIEHRIESSPGGGWVLPREAFEAVGGFDERFVAWGGDDDAWVMALDTLVGPHKRGTGACLHLWHAAPESERFGSPQWKTVNAPLLKQYRRARGNPDAMRRLIDGRKQDA